jgi:ABC-type multidrug transport system fused ATPase/permease subunit
VNKSKEAAQNIFNIIDEPNPVDSRNTSGQKSFEATDIAFKNVNFKYPSRASKVLRKMNFEIKQNQKVAFVGASGCGKSTLINLILRFYNIDSGTIEIGGKKLEDYNLKELREAVGLVM